MDNKKEHTFTERLFAVVFVFILIPIFLYFVFVGFPEDKKQLETADTTNNVMEAKTDIAADSEYGSNLSECLQKADTWLAEAKQTAKNVLAEEKTKNNRYQSYIDQNTSESEIIASLETEWRDYQSGCRAHFR